MDEIQFNLHRWKPAAGVRTQLTAASLLWTCVGLGLGSAGVFWCHGADDWPPLVGLGLAIGLIKAFWIIRPVARRNAARIIERGDGKCLGSFLSWKSWLFVAAMMAVGFVLRHSPLPRPALGVLYVAIGVALLVGALPLWRSVFVGKPA